MIRIIQILLFLLLAFQLPSLAQKSKGDTYYQQAKDAADKNDVKKSIRLFLSARTEYLKEKNYYRVLICTQNVTIYYQDTNEGQASADLLKETISAIPKTTSDELEIHAKLQDNLAYTYLYSLNQQAEALQAYNESISLFEKAGKSNTTDYAFELVNRATTHYGMQAFQKAIDDIKQAIVIYEKDSQTNPAELTEQYRTLGMSYLELGQFESAWEAYQKGLSRAELSGDKELKAKLMNDLGIVYNKQGSFLKAIEQFNLAKTMNESLFGKDADHYAQNIINIGNSYEGMGDLDNALKNYNEALTLYGKTPPSQKSDAIDLLINISRLTDELGMTEQSAIIIDQAMILAKTSGDNSLEQADVYMHKAATCFNHEEYDLSLNYNFKAMSILEANQYPVNEYYAMIYNNTGQAYDELHEIELAIQYKQKALDIYTRIHGLLHPSTAMAIGNIGLTWEMNGQYQKALEYLQKSLDIRLQTQGPTHDDVGTDYLNMGLIYLKINQPSKGITFLEKGRAIYDHYNKHIKKAMIYNRLAFGYYLLHDYTKAGIYYQKAIIANSLNFENENFDTFPVQPDFLDYYELLISYTAKTDLYTLRGDRASLTQGVRQLDAADKILKEKSVHLSNDKDRLEMAQVNSFFTESGLLLSHKFYEVSRDQSHLEKAFYYSERSKANELFSDIQMSRAVSIGKIPRKLLNRREELMRHRNTLQQQISSAYDAKNQELIAKLKSVDFDLTRELDELQNQIKAASPAYNTISSQRALPAWSDIKKTLKPGTAIVSYTLTDSAKYILIGNQTKLILKEIPPRTDIDRLVKGYVNQIKFQGPGTRALAIQLTDFLWSPVESAFEEFGDVREVIIIPDGALNYLPFESLGKDHYLLEKYVIHYQLSGALLLNVSSEKENTKPSFIALAPVFADKETNFISKSCERFVKITQKTDSATRAFSLNGDYITPLPATEEEVEKINQIHTDKGFFARNFTRENASEELIKKGELSNYDYIHFATHGFVNAQYPELSGLLLTQDAKSAEDGILYTGEILGLNLKANLVTLSACETALGKKFEGEGVRGLTSAFILAGARNVISSLWKVADESTSLLMIEFYSGLLSGKDKATALRDAKLSLIKSGEYYQPYYWAPFIQIGSN